MRNRTKIKIGGVSCKLEDMPPDLRKKIELKLSQEGITKPDKELEKLGKACKSANKEIEEVRSLYHKLFGFHGYKKKAHS